MHTFIEKIYKTKIGVFVLFVTSLGMEHSLFLLKLSLVCGLFMISSATVCNLANHSKHHVMHNFLFLLCTYICSPL